jgi:hypothetical protein
VILRGLLLALGGGYMLWRARLSWLAAGELEGGAAALSARLALVFALVGALALVTSGAAFLATRPRRRAAPLGLGPPAPGP